MGALDYSAIVIALIAFFSARSSAKTSAKAQENNNRASMEEEAYIRARAFDTETIRKQKEEIAELEKEKVDLEARLRACEESKQNKSSKGVK